MFINIEYLLESCVLQYRWINSNCNCFDASFLGSVVNLDSRTYVSDFFNYSTIKHGEYQLIYYGKGKYIRVILRERTMVGQRERFR